MLDVAIIGCGVVGAAAAYELSHYPLHTAIFEAENDVADCTTKANSAILHAGYDPEPGTRMARLNVEGSALAKEICARLDVPYLQCGSLVLALSPEELPHLQKLYENGIANGVPGIRLLSAEETLAMEPNLAPTVVGALYAPSAAIVSPWDFALAMAEVAVRNGVELHRSCPVTRIEKTAGGWALTTPSGIVETRYIINAAGVSAQAVHDMAAPHKFTIQPTRGEYYLLDKSEGSRVHHVIFQCPNENGKGVLAGLTNIVLDFLLVGVLRGGIVGAASATVISQMVGGIGPMFYFFNRKNSSLLHFVRPKFSAKALGKACANGSSELMTNLSASLVSALYNLQLMKLIGADGVAAYGVLMYVGFIFAAVFIGYAQGCAPIISYHYGAENHDELKNLFRKSITMLAIAGVAMFTSAQLMATPLAKMFVGYDAGLMELTEHALKLYAFSFLLCGFNIFSSAFFTALNNGAISAAISFLRTLVFQVFAVLVLPIVLDIDGIWYALVFAEAAALLVSAALLVKNRNRYHYA